MAAHTFHKIRTGVLTWLCLLIAAISVGWLIGLSTSPILHVIVGGVIAVVASIVSALTGIQTNITVGEDRAKSESAAPRTGVAVNPIPIAVFSVGLAIGATIGVVARTNELFGTDTAMFVRRWQGIGLTNVQLKRRLFDQMYQSLPTDRSDGRDRSSGRAGGESRDQADVNKGRGAALSASLFAASVEDCQLLAGRHGADLRAHLLVVEGDAIEDALKECRGDDCLEALRVAICHKLP